MAQHDYSIKRRKFQHLTQEKRAQIEILPQMKVPKSRITREVGIARSTLYNELARGSVEQLDTQSCGCTRDTSTTQGSACMRSTGAAAVRR